MDCDLFQESEDEFPSFSDIVDESLSSIPIYSSSSISSSSTIFFQSSSSSPSSSSPSLTNSFQFFTPSNLPFISQNEVGPKRYCWNSRDPSIPLVMKNTMPFRCNAGLGPLYEGILSSSPLDLFFLFFPISFWEKVCIWTNSLARMTTPHSFEEITISEILLFLGVCISNGLCPRPSVKDIWSSHIVFQTLISSFFVRDRFLFILKNLKLAPPIGEEIGDNLAKIRPALEKFVSTSTTCYGPGEFLSFDEMTPGYSGRTSLLKITKNKKVSSGLQFYALCCKTGFVCSLEFVFDSIARMENSRQFSSSQNCILRLISQLPRRNQHHTIFFDNLFTSPELFDEIYKRFGHYSCGTWRTNFGVPKLLKQKKITKQQIRNRKKDGDESDNLKIAVSSQKKSAVGGELDLEIDLLGCSFIDKNSVHMLSTKSYSFEKVLGGVKEKKRYPIQHSYNKFMNCVDVADQLWGSYSTYMKSVKWWKRIFFFLFDITICNCFILFNYSRPKLEQISHKDFLLKLFDNLIEKSFLLKNFYIGHTGRVSTSSSNLLQQEQQEQQQQQQKPQIRMKKRKWRSSYSTFQERSHYGWPKEIGSWVKCEYCLKIKKQRKDTKWQCSNCSIPLCVSCFEPYHTK